MSEEAPTYIGPRVCWMAWDIETGPQSREAIDAYNAASGSKKPIEHADAALHAETGEVRAIGYWLHDEREPRTFAFPDEAGMIEAFMRTLCMLQERYRQVILVGHNSLGFDLPWLLKRGIVHGIDTWVLRQCQHRDTMLQWMHGSDCRISLGGLAHVLGLPGKLGDGKDFSGLLSQDFDAARAYLQRDVEITARAAMRLFPDCPVFEREIFPVDDGNQFQCVS